MSVVLALMVSGLFPALSIYAWQTRPAGAYTENEAKIIAIHYLKNSPTFKFDGIAESVQVTGAYRARTLTPTWLVSISFECRHAGYGDRTGMMLAQVITPHQMGIIVEEGRVIEAVIDDRWDELNQHEIVESELLPPEFAKDLTIEYILENYPELGAIPTPEFWAIEILTPLGLIGSSIQQFTGGGWTVNVTYPMVMRPVYTISIRYSGDISFTWEGTVDQDRNVGEIEFRRVDITPEPPEFARDTAIDYILQTYEELGGLQVPSSWETRDLTPGLVGASNLQYIGDGWTVNVSYPVVLKPRYTVEIEYVGDTSFTWKGTVDQSGSVDEQEYAVVR